MYLAIYILGMFALWLALIVVCRESHLTGHMYAGLLIWPLWIVFGILMRICQFVGWILLLY